MLVTNHVLSGAAVGAAVRRPLPAFALGFASHFALDAAPPTNTTIQTAADSADLSAALEYLDQDKPAPATPRSRRSGRIGG